MALPFLLSYAGVPFVSDRSHAVRMRQPAHEMEDPAGQAPAKHQSDASLIDELNRLIPFEQLQDFALPGDWPGRSLDGIARESKVGPEPSNACKIGEWYYPPTASRWGVFRGLATSRAAKAMLAAVSTSSVVDLGTGGFVPTWQSAAFKMQAVPGGPSNPGNQEGPWSLETDMYMLPPRPLAELAGAFDGLYLITLVDERYYWQFTSDSLRLTQFTTWDELITSLALALGVSFNYSAIEPVYLQPEKDSQLWSTYESAAVLLDAVAFNVGRTVVRLLDGTYELQTPLESAAIALENRNGAGAVPAQVFRTAGGDIFSSGTLLPAGSLVRSKNAVVPSTVQVVFPPYVVGDDPVPHFYDAGYANQRPSTMFSNDFADGYLIEVPIASGGPCVSGQVGFDGYSPTLKSTAKATYDETPGVGDDPLNVSGLTALAVRLAGDYYSRQACVALDEVYPGTAVWNPEGFHDVIWTYSEARRQATTRVMRTEWNQFVGNFQHATPPVSGGSFIPAGVGGPPVAQTWRDSYSGSLANFQPQTLLVETMLSGASQARVASVDYFPTQNRWKGHVDDETILFEGTSGGIAAGTGFGIDVVSRGIDGTLQVQHDNTAEVIYGYPDQTYGVNLVTHEKGQWVYPADIKNGVQGVAVVPQTQTVRCLDGSGGLINGVRHHSGSVRIYDPTFNSGFQFYEMENVWLVERNARRLTSGLYYDGQFAGYSASTSGGLVASGAGSGSVSGRMLVSPVYLANATCCSGDDAATTTTTTLSPFCNQSCLWIGPPPAGGAGLNYADLPWLSGLITSGILQRCYNGYGTAALLVKVPGYDCPDGCYCSYPGIIYGGASSITSGAPAQYTFLGQGTVFVSGYGNIEGMMRYTTRCVSSGCVLCAWFWDEATEEWVLLSDMYGGILTPDSACADVEECDDCVEPQAAGPPFPGNNDCTPLIVANGSDPTYCGVDPVVLSGSLSECGNCLWVGGITPATSGQAIISADGCDQNTCGCDTTYADLDPGFRVFLSGGTSIIPCVPFASGGLPSPNLTTTPNPSAIVTTPNPADCAPGSSFYFCQGQCCWIWTGATWSAYAEQCLPPSWFGSPQAGASCNCQSAPTDPGGWVLQVVCKGCVGVGANTTCQPGSSTTTGSPTTTTPAPCVCGQVLQLGSAATGTTTAEKLFCFTVPTTGRYLFRLEVTGGTDTDNIGLDWTNTCDGAITNTTGTTADGTVICWEPNFPNNITAGTIMYFRLTAAGSFPYSLRPYTYNVAGCV